MKRLDCSAISMHWLTTIATLVLLTCGWSAGAMEIVVTSTSDDGPGSLRQAILVANEASGTDTIKFNLSGEPPFVIKPLTPLPEIRSPVIIDGSSQPGYSSSPLVVLDGSEILKDYGYARKGLAVASGPSIIRALVICRFGMWGISIEGGEGTVVEGCFIGTNHTGKSMAGNGDDWYAAGILIAGSSNNRIGGLTPDARNIISGNWCGIYLAPGADRNSIQGNFIGTDVTGTAALPNGRPHPYAAICVQGCYNVIGGTEPGAGNLISGNYSPLSYPEMGGHGILIEDQNWGQLDTVGNVIQGNLIGTDVTGTKPLPNLWGIVFRGGAKTVIGGTSKGARNVISGNACTAVGGFGIWGTPGASTQHRIEGNYIGTDITGLQLLSNGSDDEAPGGPWEPARDAISFYCAEGNVIRGNVIAGDAASGIWADSRNVIEGNLIGTDFTGTTLLGSHGGAGLVLNAGNKVIGNLISGNGGGNGGSGIDVSGPDNVIQRNFIGTDISGAQPLPNRGPGIFLSTAEAGNNQIGGAGAGNVISANHGTGIGVNSSGNVIQGNTIGTDITGTQQMGNGNGGIFFGADAKENIVGGIGEGEGNVIAFNINPGVWLADSTECKNNPIRGNSIFGNLMGIALCACPNDHLDADEGPNRLQNWPEIEMVLAGQSSTIIQGRLSSAPNTTFHLDFYSNTSVDQSGRYEGERYLGTTTVQTDPDGTCTFSVTLPVSLPAGTVVTGTATDPDGNTSEFSAPSEPVPDAEPPAISCPGDVHVGCSVEALVPVTFSVTATDNVDPAPIVTCSPPSGSGFPVGTTLVTCTATDNSGNSATCSFNVIRAALEFTGFLPPIGGADATGGDFSNPVRTFKVGSTIPVKFTAACDGAPVLTGVHTLQAIHFSDATTSDEPIDASPTDAATTGNQFRLVDGQWHFNLDTKTTGMGRGIWQLRATLADGSQHHVWIQLK